jgi:MFS family permease
MGLDEVGFGVLSTAVALGSLAGSLLVERVERRLGRGRLLLVAVVVSAVTMAVPGVSPNPWIVGAAFAASGVAIMMWNVVTVSLRQRIVPDHLLGRVNASYRLLAWGSQPLGALLGGIVGELLGLRAVFLLAGAGTLVLVLGSRIVTDRAIAAAEASSETSSGPGSRAGSELGAAIPLDPATGAD